MNSSNEKWQGNSSSKSDAGASRDGKSFERRDVKSFNRDSRGTVRNSYNDGGRPERPSYGNSDYNRRNEGGHAAYGERKPYENNRPAYGERKSYNSSDNRNQSGGGYGRSSYSGNRTNGNSDRKPSDSKPSYGERKPYPNRDRRPSYGEGGGYENSERRPFKTNSEGEKVYGRPRFVRKTDENSERPSFRKPTDSNNRGEFYETRFDNKVNGVTFRKRKNGNYDPNAKYSQKKQLEFRKNFVDLTKPVRLNKFLANAGICSRREADEYIQAGVISVNGQIITEMGIKILPTDKVTFHDQQVHSEKKVYLLLNKPKDCVTTAEDTNDRLTVLDLVKNACSERIYPVGRLDRNTTGVLLLTNDGDLASRLTHPKYDKKKIYHVGLDKPLQPEDYNSIMSGVQLEDETTIAADALEFVKEGDMKQVGVEIHSGQNRIVRRIFEKLGYKVIKLDRVYFAGLTKKNLSRGKYRFLSEREINMLKMGAHE